MPIVVGEEDIIETKILCWVNFQVGINVRHWRCGTNPGGLTLEDWMAHLVAELEPLYTAYLATTTIVDAIKTKIIGPAGVSEELTELRGTAGLAAATTMARQASGIVTLTTGLGGRKNRGRIYLPFVTEEMNETTGSPNGAGITAMENVATFYSTVQNVTVGDFTMILAPVLVHRGPAPDEPTPITGFIVRDKWATQLRRGDYGPINPRLS